MLNPELGKRPSLKLLAYIALASICTGAVMADEQHDTFQLSLSVEALQEGSLNIDEEALVGVEIKYFFLDIDRHHFFTSLGYRTDAENEGSSLDIFSVDVGSQFDLFTYWGNRSYLEYSLGAAYLYEEFSTRLIDREITRTFDSVGYKASLGLGFEFFQSFSTKLQFNQYDGDSRTAGLTFSYSF